MNKIKAPSTVNAQYEEQNNHFRRVIEEFIFAMYNKDTGKYEYGGIKEVINMIDKSVEERKTVRMAPLSPRLVKSTKQKKLVWIYPKFINNELPINPVTGYPMLNPDLMYMQINWAYTNKDMTDTDSYALEMILSERMMGSCLVNLDYDKLVENKYHDIENLIGYVIPVQNGGNLLKMSSMCDWLDRSTSDWSVQGTNVSIAIIRYESVPYLLIMEVPTAEPTLYARANGEYPVYKLYYASRIDNDKIKGFVKSMIDFLTTPNDENVSTVPVMIGG